MGGSNRMLDPGSVSVSAPYFISGLSGVLPAAVAANAAVARLMHFGMQDPRTPGAIVPTPIQVSRIWLKYSPAAAPVTLADGFYILKGTCDAQASGGAGLTVHLPQRRKTTGYPAIIAAETSLAMAGTAAITGGTFAPFDATGPIDLASTGSLATAESIWMPFDLCPDQLEAGEAFEVRTIRALSGSGILLVAFDFLR
jgi:hypothetical protein